MCGSAGLRCLSQPPCNLSDNKYSTECPPESVLSGYRYCHPAAGCSHRSDHPF